MLKKTKTKNKNQISVNQKTKMTGSTCKQKTELLKCLKVRLIFSGMSLQESVLSFLHEGPKGKTQSPHSWWQEPLPHWSILPAT